MYIYIHIYLYINIYRYICIYVHIYVYNDSFINSRCSHCNSLWSLCHSFSILFDWLTDWLTSHFYHSIKTIIFNNWYGCYGFQRLHVFGYYASETFLDFLKRTCEPLARHSWHVHSRSCLLNQIHTHAYHKYCHVSARNKNSHPFSDLCTLSWHTLRALLLPAMCVHCEL